MTMQRLLRSWRHCGLLRCALWVSPPPSAAATPHAFGLCRELVPSSPKWCSHSENPAAPPHLPTLHHLLVHAWAADEPTTAPCSRDQVMARALPSLPLLGGDSARQPDSIKLAAWRALQLVCWQLFRGWGGSPQLQRCGEACLCCGMQLLWGRTQPAACLWLLRGCMQLQPWKAACRRLQAAQ